MNERLNYLMQQLAENRRRDAAIKAYKQEVQTAPEASTKRGYADMLRAMKGEPAPEAEPEPQTAPPYIAEPEITPEGGRLNAYRKTLYGITSYL